MALERNRASMSENPLDDTYRYERDLVAAFVDSLAADGLFGIQEIALEFDYRRGRTDIIAVSSDGRVIAFEAKLSNWRDAMYQAYRNTCFAAESYIVMPRAAALRAAAHSQAFVDRGVGICSMSATGADIIHPAPKRAKVIEPWLAKRAAQYASSSSGE